MVGVSWVFGMQNTLKEVEAIVENFHAVSVGNYKVDCVPYNPTECVEGKNIQGCFLLHHSYCPDSSFTLFAPLNAKKPIAASSDRGMCSSFRFVSNFIILGFDLILSKLSKALTPEIVGKFEVTGTEYHLVDFRIRVGSTVMNSVSKGVIVEIEYAPTSLPSHACPLIAEAVEDLFPGQQIDQPDVFNKHFTRYTMGHTVQQYLQLFQNMRKKTA